MTTYNSEINIIDDDFIFKTFPKGTSDEKKASDIIKFFQENVSISNVDFVLFDTQDVDILKQNDVASNDLYYIHWIVEKPSKVSIIDTEFYQSVLSEYLNPNDSDEIWRDLQETINEDFRDLSIPTSSDYYVGIETVKSPMLEALNWVNDVVESKIGVKLKQLSPSKGVFFTNLW